MITPEEREELVSEMYDAFHPLFLGTEETEHAESLQTALKRLGFYHGRIDGDFSRGTRRSVQAAQFSLLLPVSGEVDDGTAEAITELLKRRESQSACDAKTGEGVVEQTHRTQHSTSSLRRDWFRYASHSRFRYVPTQPDARGFPYFLCFSQTLVDFIPTSAKLISK